MLRIRPVLAAALLAVALVGCVGQETEDLVTTSAPPVATTPSTVPGPAIDTTTTTFESSEPDEAATLVERPEWGDAFATEGVVGTIAVHKIGSDRIDVFDPNRAEEPRTPASTFKILNSLVILETSVLPDVETEVLWDGQDRGIPVWNQDHSLRSGIQVSAVWLYQQMAREVGSERMSDWVSKAEYGNADISGGIDQFWLSGALRISVFEQIDFLSRLVQGELPFSGQTVAAVREILVRESGDGWAWSHKTGTSLSSIPDLGWLVGIAENANEEWVFALNIDLERVDDVATQLNPQARQRIARVILESEGALPGS